MNQPPTIPGCPRADVGQDGILRPVINRPGPVSGILKRPVGNRPQVNNLPQMPAEG
jgi:hypothetical protein